MASRKEILEMLSRGEIDVERATELLAQIPASPAQEAPPTPPAPEAPAAPETPPAPEASFEPPAPPTPPSPSPRPPAVSPRHKTAGKWRSLHIDVSELDSGRSRVRINVPLGLMRFGMRIGARFTNELDRETVDEVLSALDGEELSGTLVEVEDVEDNERVHIYID